MAYLTPLWVPVYRAAKFPNIEKVYKRAGRGQGTGQGISPPWFQTLTGLATAAGTTGQISFTASTNPVQVGQAITIIWGGTGTGTISGYTNPTTYLIGVTNGSTTATITTLSGGVVTTTAGTLTGATATNNTTPPGTLISQPKGFLMTVKIWIQGETLANNQSPPALPAWIRLPPGVEKSSWQNYQVDVTNIPGVRPLRKDGRWVGTPY